MYERFEAQKKALLDFLHDNGILSNQDDPIDFFTNTLFFISKQENLVELIYQEFHLSYQDLSQENLISTGDDDSMKNWALGELHAQAGSSPSWFASLDPYSATLEGWVTKCQGQPSSHALVSHADQILNQQTGSMHFDLSATQSKETQAWNAYNNIDVIEKDPRLMEHAENAALFVYLQRGPRN